MRNRVIALTALSIAMCLMFVSAPRSRAWGDDGHRFINLVAAQKLPDDMPAFFRNASTRLSYLGPEPDRWRDTRERSEEHTLQHVSISYAVFCLKKKNPAEMP